MERLSSCYFCGDAVDAAVSEFPLVQSDRFEVDTDHQIVLCSTCRRKLTEVLERVLTAAFNGEQPPDPAAAMAGDDQMTATSVEAVDEGSSEPDEVPSPTDPDVDIEDDDPLVDVGEDRAGSDAPEADHASTNGVAATAEDEDDDDEDAGDAAGATAGEQTERDYEKAEFNKVVRLLQNREFPVELDELVTVAGSAYGIDEPTCHVIVAELVDRGVVADEGDRLVRPQ